MRAKRAAVLSCGVALALATLAARAAEPPPPRERTTVAQAYPGLAAGTLSSATLGDLPPGVLARSGQVEITATELHDLFAKAPAAKRAELRDSAVFLLGEFAAKKLLTRAARAAAAEAGTSLEGKSDYQVVNDYLAGKVAHVTVADAEVAAFYDENRSMFEGSKLEQIKPRLTEFLLKQKRQEAMKAYVHGLGKALVVSAAWVKQQVALAGVDPVAEARASGRPSMVDFGAEGCRPCDLMAPILEHLKKKHEGKANVVFVHVQKKPALARSYNVTSIPTQVFFDKGGKEVYRHTGFYSERRIERKLREMGVR